MLKKVYVVINVIGGCVDSVDVFAEEKDVKHRYRELIEENSYFTRKEILEQFSEDKEAFDNVWQRDSEEFLYSSEEDLYYPISTGDHDVYQSEEFIDYDGYGDEVSPD